MRGAPVRPPRPGRRLRLRGPRCHGRRDGPTRLSGLVGVLAAAVGARVVGLDREPDLLRIAARRARPTHRARHAGHAAAWFVAGNALALPFPADSFDAVLSTFGVN
ncbi:methyltransferase domain-containing protein [Streptomyces sp. NPDC007020]|uniref:class I SAM-dependent methyltransferase n=1 Tax=Streptomyces sp. NPDC007020 TaxID=3154585 RepID=UPI0033C5530D